MNVRTTLVARRRARGAMRPVVIAIIAIVAALAAAAWLLIVRPYRQQMQLDAGGMPAVPSAAAKQQAAAAPANLQEMDVNQLLSEASKALKAQRLLAPAGNNAFEFYLRVLAKQPGNPVATGALRETFPYAATSAEQAISSGDYGEAQREIDLLAKADPSNYTLTILRSKLDAQRKLASQQQQQAKDQQKAADLAAQKAAAAKQEAAQQAAQQQAQLAAEQAKAKQQQAAQQHQQAAAPAPAQPAQAAVASVQTSDAVLLKAANPNYPSAALRAGQSGWVIVGFTVTPEGRTSDVHVVDAQPRHVFDRAAMEAVTRYRFKPAMRDGTAVASSKQQKIEFSNGR